MWERAGRAWEGRGEGEGKYVRGVDESEWEEGRRRAGISHGKREPTCISEHKPPLQVPYSPLRQPYWEPLDSSATRGGKR